MPANVRSVAAIADFRAALTTFGDTAKRALDEVDMELGRAIEWVSDEQPAYWKGQVQVALDEVADRRNELDQCERRAYDGQRPSCYQERKALEAAKRHVRHCEDKIDVVRRWSRTVQQEVSEYHADVSKFRALLDGDLPKSLALLDRMVSALEAYAAIPVVPATPVGQGISESIARTESDEPPAEEKSIFQALREHTPALETRQTAKMRAADETEIVTGEDDPAADEGAAEQAALKLAYELQLEPAFPDWNDQVVLLAGALEQEQVYLERIESPEGDSGWFIGPIEPKLGVTAEYEALSVAEVLRRRPALVRALALPVGYMAVFSHSELVAIVDPEGRDQWKLAGGEEQETTD
jgi:hypothetical protein